MKAYLDQRVPFTLPQVRGEGSGVEARDPSGRVPRADPFLPQQPPGQAAPGGALMGVGKRPGDPGLLPAQDSEGKGVREGRVTVKATGRGAGPPPLGSAVPPQRSAEETSRFPRRALPGLGQAPGDVADRR